MSDDHHDGAGTVDPAEDDVLGGPAGRGHDRIRRHLVVLFVALVGLAIGGALVIGGRSTSTGTPSNRSGHGTTAEVSLPSHGPPSVHSPPSSPPSMPST